MEEGEIVVLDASVVIKWFSDEEHTERALEIRTWYVDNRISVYVPDLLVYELSNALRYNPDFGVADAQKADRVFLREFALRRSPQRPQDGRGTRAWTGVRPRSS